MTNPILANDSYKLSHRNQLPKNTTKIYSHLTPRFVKYLKQKFPSMDDKVIVYGLQSTIAIVTERWNKEFFQRPWDDIEAETLHVLTPMLGWTSVGLAHFKDLHTLGYLPLEFKALPEGSHVGINIPVLTVQNTHPDFAWLTNFVESTILNNVYKPMTVATLSLELARLRNKYFDLTVSDQSGIDFALHDFSYRGHSGHDSASHTISAYLLYTKGTDTMSAVAFAQEYYKAGKDIAGSIPAFEHSTATLNIQLYRNVLQTTSPSELDVEENTYGLGIQACRKVRDQLIAAGASQLEIELAIGETFSLARNLLEVYPVGLFAYVSDSYNYQRLVNVIIPALKDVILSRDGKLVIRPDSGNPVHIVCGYVPVIAEEDTIQDWYKEVYTIPPYNCLKTKDGSYYAFNPGVDEYGEFSHNIEKITEEELKGSIESLWDTFGGTVNDKGYKVLDSHIGLVYGDGINYKRIQDIYQNLLKSL